MEKIKYEVINLFGGDDNAFYIEACGAFRRGDISKEIDILINRTEEGPTKNLLLRLIENLEVRGLILE